MKTMQFSLFHTSVYVDILLQDKKCLCLPGARSSRGWCICPVNWPPFPPVFGLRGGETAINQISEEDFSPHHCTGHEEVLTKDYTGARLQPTPFLHHIYDFLSAHCGTSVFLRAVTPPLQSPHSWINFWIISTRVYVNLIRNLSDMNT